MRVQILFLFSAIQFLLISCDNRAETLLFTQLSPEESGITFSNNLTESDSLNYFLYKYMYMGGGVALGDVNNDGLQDIYFTGNMVENKLYLNKGDLKFEDITHTAKVAADQRWVTGVTMADVNQDGWLDIYVSVAGGWTTTKNLLYINDAKDGELPSFTESAELYGIADRGNSVQSVFFDYDLDGDLDLYVANYPITDIKTGIYNYREMMRYVIPDKSNHLYKNNNGKFEDVTNESGIMRFGLSLGLAVGDYNNDGYPDLYVSNDFATPDYFFFNNGDGTFSEQLKTAVNHTAFYGMGIDTGDFNNDGLLDILQVDMTPEDNYKSKSNMGSMNTEAFQAMIESGMHYQYMKNALQMNMGNNAQGISQFSEISQLANISLTDWSWAPLFADFDNDGWKDIFITNGSRREINNKDFFKEMSEDKNQRVHYMEWLKKMPQYKTENYALRNKGGLNFKPVAEKWGINFKGWSNGAAYADLDNDGDLELVVNNIDDTAIIYKNNATSYQKSNYLRIVLNGPIKNKFGLGTKVTLLQGNQKQFQELTMTRGFQSSVEPILHFGLGDKKNIKKIIVIWPDGQQETVENVKANQQIVFHHKNAIKKENIEEISQKKLFKNITKDAGLTHKHRENKFDDYKYQILLPHKMSQMGPALAVADVNNDGLDDFFVGGAKGYSGALYIQTQEGKFQSLSIDVFKTDKIHEDVDAVFFDANGDQLLDLYVVSGGNEARKGDMFYQDRLYLNQGSGTFVKAINAFPKMLESGSVVRVADFDKDGDNDLFIGSRLSPHNYPVHGKSYLLQNESTSDEVRFVDVTDDIATGLATIGMVTDGVWIDVDGDNWEDLVLTGEWMSVTVFKNSKGQFTNETETFGLSGQTGWWSSILAGDFDTDGDIDFIAGNLGENYKYKASEKNPFNVYVNDYDKNNSSDIVLSYIQNGEEYPVRGRQCSSEQIPAIATKFKDYNSFAKASLSDVYSAKALKESTHYKAVNFSTCYIENKGNKFLFHRLENMAQISSVNAIYSKDINNDGNLDIILAGNLYESEVETPRNDASYGLYLEGNGKGDFISQMPYESGLMIKGEVKHLLSLKLSNGKIAILAALNDSKIVLIGLN